MTMDIIAKASRFDANALRANREPWGVRGAPREIVDMTKSIIRHDSGVRQSAEALCKPRKLYRPRSGLIGSVS